MSKSCGHLSLRPTYRDQGGICDLCQGLSGTYEKAACKDGYLPPRCNAKCPGKDGNGHPVAAPGLRYGGTAPCRYIREASIEWIRA